MEQGRTRARREEWKEERDGFVRAFSGALFFGIPLLYTMEMWWIGTYAELWKLLIFLAVAFGVNLYLNYFSGFKERSTFANHLDEAVDVVAVGIVASLLMLVVLNRISFSDPLDSILGKVIIQAVPLSIGASVANSLFAINERGKDRHGDENDRSRTNREDGSDHWRATLNDIGATVAGGIFIGFPLAPTDEVPLLAAALEPRHELALIGLTLLLTFSIVFESGFNPRNGPGRSQGPFQEPFTETALAYAVSLFVALLALYLFDRIEFGEPLGQLVSQVLVLGLPTAIGGAAGRLVV